MAANNQNEGQEKTEKPTQRKIDKAREDGKIVSSKEMFVLTSVFMMLVMCYLLPSFVRDILGVWGNMFSNISGVSKGISPLTALKESIFIIFKVGLIIGVPLLLVTLFTQLFVGGLIFSLKSIEWKSSKINPIEGLKRIFSMKGLVELGKAILKVVSLFGIGVLVLKHIIPEIIQITKSDLEMSLNIGASYFPIMLIFLMGGLLIIALLDFAWQKHSFIKSLLMNRQDLKDEHKETEGNPEVKAKIKRLQIETAQKAIKQGAALEDVKDATAVFVNPTHFAVAVKYTIGNDSAPIVLAMGRGNMAEKIIEKAKSCKITVFSSPILARALYFTSEIGLEISEKLYTAVAIALAYIYKIEQGENIDEPNIEVPEELIFDEEGLQKEI